MDIRIINSPAIAPEQDLSTRLTELLRTRDYDRFTAVVAWVKRSGLRHLEPSLRAFRSQGGHISILAGIDANGATRQGLELARELADEVAIFHEPGAGTFHPKVYLLEGRNKASALVGSANLTLGGLRDNNECTVELEIDLPADKTTLDRITAWIDDLRAETELCLELTDGLLEKLIRGGFAADEDRHRPGKSADGVAKVPLLPFGKRSRQRGRRPAPPLWTPLRRPGTTVVSAPAPPATLAPVTAPISARWFKRLDSAGAQQPGRVGTNPTGVLRLTQARLPIDQTTYFRRSLFVGAPWIPRGVGSAGGETAVVPFEVTVDGRYLGRVPLTLSHAAHREAGQGNYTTALHWGTLSPVLRGTDYTGRWVVIDRASDGTYALRIQRIEPSPA